MISQHKYLSLEVSINREINQAMVNRKTEGPGIPGGSDILLDIH